MAILSLDCGTTGVTALIVGTDASILARGYREFPQHFPHDGGGASAALVEHDPGEIWAATLEATREALAASPEAPTAVGITNQRETVCFWDRETLGSPRRAIVSTGIQPSKTRLSSKSCTGASSASQSACQKARYSSFSIGQLI